MLNPRSDLDVNLTDMFGSTALMYASQQEEGEGLVRLLLERRDLDLDGKDGDGRTAEDYAGALSYSSVVRIIREERSRRMGGVWTQLETSREEEEEKEDISEEGEALEEEVEKSRLTQKEEDDCEETDFLQSQLRENLRARLSRERALQEQREEKYRAELSRLKIEKEDSEKVLRQKLQELEKNFQTSKRHLDESYKESNQKRQSMITRLEKALANIDLSKILNTDIICSELECPICLEEMRPPTRIWQCSSGHPVCESCMRNPRLSECPTCREKIVGRNVLAEKIAQTLFQN